MRKAYFEASNTQYESWYAGDAFHPLHTNWEILVSAFDSKCSIIFAEVTRISLSLEEHVLNRNVAVLDRLPLSAFVSLPLHDKDGQREKSDESMHL